MQTSQVNNVANVLTATPSAGKTSNSNAPEPFGKVLSREVSGRNGAKDSTAPRETANGAAKTNAKSGKPAEAKPAQQDKRTEGASDAGDTTEPPSRLSDDMLALVANLSHLTHPAGDQATETSEATEDTSSKDETAALTGIPLLGAEALVSRASTVAPAGVSSEVTARIDKLDSNRPITVRDLAAKPEVAAAADAGAKKVLPFDPAVEATGSSETNAQSAALAATSATETDMVSTTGTVASAMHPVQQTAVQAVQQMSGATEKLTPRVGTPAWDQALGQKVVWMVAGEQQSASLTLNPPDLGPLQVVLSVNNSQANATFIAAQPEVRQAIEDAMPKLRDMLGEAGIQLGQTSVNSGTPGQQQGGFDQQAAQSARGLDPLNSRDAANAEPARTSRVQPALSSGRGLVDTFV